jgi:hypothetical protein
MNVECYGFGQDAVSVGHVGQLVMDVILENAMGRNAENGMFTPAFKIGRIHHPALEPVVGLCPFSIIGQPELMTSCECEFVSETLNMINV